MPRFGRLALLTLPVLTACGQPSAPRPPDRGADKARLFADPGLVPTREGERARRELSLAGQVRRAMAEIDDVASVTVDVELEPDPHRVLVAISTRASDSARREQLEHYANEAATAVVGGPAEVTVLLDTAPAPEPEHRGALPLPLAIALIGLGVSGGIAAERWRNRART